MVWVDSFKKHWSSIVTVACLIIVAIVSAWQQAVSDLPANSPIPRLNGWWHYVPLALLVLAGVVWLAGSRSRKRQDQQSNQPSRAMSASGILTLSALQGQLPNVNFNAHEWFRTAYHSPLTGEVEQNIRIIAERNQPNDHEGFYARFIGVGLVSYTHDMTWAYIFKSQLFMLIDVNRNNGMLPLAQAKTYYDKAIVDYPRVYGAYSFEQWIGYMLGQQLLLKHPSDMLEITHRGKDLLKYLAHWGRDANIKTG